MKGETDRSIRFGDWQAFPARSLLLGPEGEVHIEPKVMQVLQFLAASPGQVVQREDLLDEIWAGRTFSDEPLSRCIFGLRQALGDSAKSPRYIETIPKIGYRLIPSVELFADATNSSGDKLLGPGRHRIAFALVLGTIFLAAIFVAFRTNLVGTTETPLVAVEGAIMPKPPVYSIAVMPFVTIGSNSDDEIFSDGLSEELISSLARIEELKVTGRTSSFYYKGRDEDLRKIGSALGVAHVLEGSVRRSGDNIRITAQLTQTSDGFNLWSETYSRTMSDIFAIQDEVANAIVGALKMQVNATPPRRLPTENMEAYALYLKARATLNANRFEEAEEMLSNVLDLDPKFAKAHELLSSLYARLPDSEKSGEAAAKALAMDPELVYANALLANANATATLLNKLEAFEHAMGEEPNIPHILGWVSWYKREAGYLEDAVGVAQRWVALEPLSLEANADLGYALAAAGNGRDALAVLELVRSLSDRDFPSYEAWWCGEIYLAQHSDELAIAQFEASVNGFGYADVSWIRELVAGARNPVTGQAVLDRRIPQIVNTMRENSREEWRLDLNSWYLFFGFTDRYFELMHEDMPQINDMYLHRVMKFRHLGITAHPQFLEIAKSLGLIEVWDKHGPPDFCDKVNGDWVCK